MIEALIAGKPLGPPQQRTASRAGHGNQTAVTRARVLATMSQP